MCKSVPQTPQAPFWSKAAFFGIDGQGTLRITGRAPGPSKVATRISFRDMYRGQYLPAAARLSNRIQPSTIIDETDRSIALQ